MDWQTYIAVSIVALTVTVFIVRLFYPKKKGSCGHDCGCGKKPE